MTINITDITSFLEENPTGTFSTHEIVSLIEESDYMSIIDLLRELKEQGLKCCYRTSPIPERGIYLE